MKTHPVAVSVYAYVVLALLWIAFQVGASLWEDMKGRQPGPVFVTEQEGEKP